MINGCAEDGGGILNNGTLTVTNSTFLGNSAGGLGGGGILNIGRTMVTNSTFSENTGTDGGGSPPGRSCDNPGNAGNCSPDPIAPAPTISRNGALLALALLVGIGAVAVLRRRGGT